MIAGILKPMPGYGVHYRANIGFPARGREYIVDDEAIKKAKASADLVLTADFDDAAKAKHKAHLIQLSAGIVEDGDKPLVFSQKAYDYMREAFGVQLVNESWDGAPRPPEAKQLTLEERVAQLEHQLAALAAPRAAPREIAATKRV